MKASSSCEAAGSTNRAIFASCIPRILRNILCFNSLSTCPFDNNCPKEDDNEKSDRSNPIGSSGNATPGVVAKLMGLESLPLERRRRGMIIPVTYHEAEDENFYIFNFESHFKSKKKKSSKKMVRKKDGLVKEKDIDNNVNDKEDLLSNLQVEEDGRRSNVLHPLNNSICQRNSRLKRAKVNCETEIDSENSSPNSVLEFVEFSGDHHQQASCSGDVTRIGNSRMRRTLCEELEKCEASKDNKKMLLIGFGENKVYDGNWDEIGIEVTKLSWVQDEIFRNRNQVKEIGVDIASLVLGQLLDELIGNLNHF